MLQLKHSHKEVLEWLEELDTGKAQPLFHPFPIINIFCEDGEEKITNVKEKSDEDKLLLGMTGMARGFSKDFKGEAVKRAEAEGAKMNEGSPEFWLEADNNGISLKNSAAMNMVALKATFGTISRHGLCVDTPSLTQVAIGAKSVTACAKILEAVAAVDKKDPMSRDCYIYDFTEALGDNLDGMKIAVPFEMFGVQPTKVQLTAFGRICDTLEEKGAVIEGVDMEWEEYILPVNQMIAACERTMQVKDRENMPDLLKYDVELGDFLLDRENYEKYYLKLLKVRSLIKDSFDKLLRDYAVLMVPYVWEEDIYLAGANLAGLPSMAVSIAPAGSEYYGMAGAQMVAGANQEKNLLKAAYAYTSVFEKEEV